MKDTSPEMEDCFNDMMMQKSGEERLKMGFSMFDTSRRQVIASIKMNNPEADDKAVRKELFDRFYGQDFSSEESGKILAGI
ncbi:MAG: hypothetical protein HY808_12450 [Nitrospirae bacterium]|nr:hypothetical protein [Nitrospirota bacterium]